jgi:hypothetical protein
MPEELAGRSWHSLFSGETLTAVQHKRQLALPAAQVFARFPVALLLDQDESSI